MGSDWVARSEALTLHVRNFVGGRWQPGSGEQPLTKFSPRDGRRLCSFDNSGARDVDEAVTIARRAFEDGRWSRMPAHHRRDVLSRLASLIEQNREELALLECLDVGKPIRDALNFDAPIAAARIRFNGEAADKWYGKVYAVDRSSLSYQLHRPIGVIAAIIGWNFPLVLAAEKLGPVLATGNCLVLKPSELTSFSAARVAELAVQAGVPEGVFNVLHGDASVGAMLAHHRDVNAVTFTGSSRTGKKLLVAAGESNMKRLILECGGKAPNIVFDDCPPLDGVADAILARAFWNQGQVCTASSRLLVQQTVQEELLSVLTKKAAQLRPGDPLNPQTRFGPVVSREHKQKVMGYIDSGEKEGARVAFRSDDAPPDERGFYVPSVIFDQVSPLQTIAQEEIFGPVLSVLGFQDEEEAVRIANSTIYGLSAVLWTKDLGRAHRVTQAIDAGWIVINANSQSMGGPGTGVLSIGGHKESGIGLEGGIEGLESYTRKTAVQVFV